MHIKNICKTTIKNIISVVHLVSLNKLLFFTFRRWLVNNVIYIYYMAIEGVAQLASRPNFPLSPKLNWKASTGIISHAHSSVPV